MFMKMLFASLGFVSDQIGSTVHMSLSLFSFVQNNNNNNNNTQGLSNVVTFTSLSYQHISFIKKKIKRWQWKKSPSWRIEIPNNFVI